MRTAFAKITIRATRVLALALALAVPLVAAGCNEETAPPPGQRSVSEPIEGNIYFTGAWGGEWNVLLTFRDCNSEDIIVVEDIVDVICPTDTLHLDFTRLLDECEGVVDDSRMSASCEYAYTVSGCTIRVSFAISVERDGDLVSGSGIWSTATSGNCNGIYSLGCETIEVAGSRTGPVPASCDTLASDFMSRLSARPASLLRALGSN